MQCASLNFLEVRAFPHLHHIVYNMITQSNHSEISQLLSLKVYTLSFLDEHKVIGAIKA